MVPGAPELDSLSLQPGRSSLLFLLKYRLLQFRNKVDFNDADIINKKTREG